MKLIIDMNEAEQMAVAGTTAAIATKVITCVERTGRSALRLFGENLTRELNDIINAKFGWTVICGALPDSIEDGWLFVRLMSSAEVTPKFHEVEAEGVMKVATAADMVVQTNPAKFNNTRVEVFSLPEFNDSFFARRSIVNRLETPTYENLMDYFIRIEDAVNEHC